MPRNHPRLNQTSRHLLQSWRANCDVQLLVYNSSPSKPNIAEIAKVTDYIVGYQCKGNHTWKEEREQTKKLILATEDVGLGKDHLRKIAKQIMNKTATKRIISKQEAMVLLAGLPLTMCTETVESISINNSTKLKTATDNKQDTRFITEYSKRPVECEHLSLYQYFLFMKNDGKLPMKGKKYIIPNFIGYSGAPCFPISESYARHTIIVYTPWREYPTKRNWKSEFQRFINSQDVPTSCRMGYDRVMLRFFHNVYHYEPTSAKVDHTGNMPTEEALELLNLVGLQGYDIEDRDTYLMKCMDRGITHKWDRPPTVSTFFDTNHINKMPYIDLLFADQSRY